MAEFVEREPRLFLNPDAAILSATRCRLRPREHYLGVDFVVRQTAPVTIAALHGGTHFRNSLLAGFATPGLGAELLVGLLNSTLFRALHLAHRRDARQAAFPQVKISHLRSLPSPPEDAALRAEVAAITKEASELGTCTKSFRERLDRVVFRLYGFEADEAVTIESFLDDRMSSPSR